MREKEKEKHKRMDRLSREDYSGTRLSEGGGTAAFPASLDRKTSKATSHAQMQMEDESLGWAV